MADSSVNKVILIGRLGADPELRYTGSGKAVCNFNVATSRSWDGADGNREERTDWHKIVAWGKQGENCREYLVKGQQVYLEGRLETRSWEDRDGNKRYTTEVVARSVLFLAKPAPRPGDGEPPRFPNERDNPPPPFDPADDDIPF